MPHAPRSFGQRRRAFSAHFREYIDLFLHSLWTVICPPLFFDWQEFHIKSQGKLPLAKCWTKSTKMFYLFNGLFYVEHIIFCLPIVLLKFSVDQRNDELLHGHFSLLPEVNTSLEYASIEKLGQTLISFFFQEEESTRNVNILFGTSLALLLLILPITQIGLGLAYFKFGHPWKRIMQ